MVLRDEIKENTQTKFRLKTARRYSKVQGNERASDDVCHTADEARNVSASARDARDDRADASTQLQAVGAPLVVRMWLVACNQGCG